MRPFDLLAVALTGCNFYANELLTTQEMYTEVKSAFQGDAKILKTQTFWQLLYARLTKKLALIEAGLKFWGNLGIF